WRHTPVILLVGPEGGWTPEEGERIRAAGGRPVTLGPRLLRTETAAIAALSLLAAAESLESDFTPRPG
ncbi:MAG: RNA methyltransferase, partial [Magnetococcales bacterium]|nr:RNA methyltransferase [Magnetococcales bacterium]